VLGVFRLSHISNASTFLFFSGAAFPLHYTDAAMKLLAMVLSLCVITCSGEEPEYTGLTELLDSILSYEHQHKQLEEKTGFQVLRGFDFYDEHGTGSMHDRDASDGGLLIADSRDSEDMPLPLGWREVGSLLNEPIQSSLIEREEFPTWQLWLCCFVAVIGLSLILTGSGMIYGERALEMFAESKESRKEESCLPSYFSAPIRTYSNVAVGFQVRATSNCGARRPSLNLALS
jgi:hypothetical protein